MTNLIQKAAQQALSEMLGQDEARVYLMILEKKEKDLEKEFSYSKRYRVMKSLFDSGALGKFKQKDKDSFSYLILPPCFLYFQEETVDKRIMEFLESIYLKNHSAMLEKELSQIILRDERSLLVFLLKYFMKDNAKILVQELDLRKIMGNKSDRVTFLSQGSENRRHGTIDKKISFEFVSIPAKNNLLAREYIGYFSREPESNHPLVH
jgi:hypothetical protein